MTPETISVDKALWERCERFVRDFASGPDHLEGPRAREARAIVAQLPPPVDPLLLRAREICGAAMPNRREHFASGAGDSEPIMAAILDMARGGSTKALREGEG